MRKGERRKQELVDTAAELFIRHGYENTSLQDILDRVGCSKGSFYHHFEAKMDLLAEIARQHAANGFKAFQVESGEDPLLSLNRLLYQACPFRAGEEGFLSNLIQLMRARDSAILEQVLREATHDHFYAAFLDGLRLADTEDEGPVADEAACFLVWQGFLDGCLLILREAALVPLAGPGRGVQLLRALRRQMEALLCLPYGSLLVIDAEEMARVLEGALSAPAALA